MDVQMVLQQAHQMVRLNNVIRLHLHEFVVCTVGTPLRSIPSALQSVRVWDYSFKKPSIILLGF